MRLADLLNPHLDGVHTVIETGADEVDLGPYLHLPGGVAHVRRDVSDLLAGEQVEKVPGETAADADFGAGVLVVALGPDATPDRGEGCRRVVERLRPGGRAVVLFRRPPAEMPYHLLLDDLVAGGCQVVQAASLEYVHLRSGIVIAAVEEVQPPRDYFGRATITGAVDRHRTLLRTVNEYVLADLVTREMRSRLADLERTAAKGGRAGAEDPRTPRFGEQPVGEQFIADRQELTRLQAALADRDAALRRLEGRLAALEGSTKLRIGQAFADAARRPAHGAIALPRQLYRLWRHRYAPTPRRPTDTGAGPGRSISSTSAAHSPRVARFVSDDHRLLGHPAVSLGPRDQPVIAGILRDETCAALELDAVVNPMLPHDALLVLERTEPDVVLIEAAAAAGGPWAYLGNLVAVDRDQRLTELIAAAHALGRPVVLCRNAPAYVAPGLVRFWGGGTTPPDGSSDAAFDAVFDGDLGVQLGHLGPIDLDPDRPRDPVYVGPRDPREPPAVRRLLDAVLAEGGVRVAEPLTWRERAAVHRGNAVFLAASRRQILEQLAAGGRVIATSHQLVDGDLAAHAMAVTGPEHAGGRLRAAAEAGPRAPGEVRAALRALFREHTVRARLGELFRGLGLAFDPLDGRRMAVLVRLADAGEAGRFADAVLRQHHRPAEVAVHAPVELGRALDELRAAGVLVRAGRGPSLADLAAVADAPWAVPWSVGRDYPDTYLLDLGCAQESSRADVVGHPEGGAPDRTPDYVYVPTLVPALIRRDLLLAERFDEAPTVRHAETWARRGARLFAVRHDPDAPGG